MPRLAQLARSLSRLLLVLQGTLALAAAYLLVLLRAARDFSSQQVPASGPSANDQTALRLVVIIPAHDEQHGIGATLQSLAACRYPESVRRTVVVADNCTDETADLARAAGVEVWERHNLDERGKGHALIWALEQLHASSSDFDAVVVLDADCLVSPNMLGEIDAALRSGAQAVQVSYVVGNPDDSYVSALRYAGFSLMNIVRPLGKQGLGLSCGLFGSGMAFTAELLRSEPWTATGFVEDFEYHLRIVNSGWRVQFLPKAQVTSAMPTSFSAGAGQQARWEQGKLQVIRAWSLPLILTGLLGRDRVRVHAGFEHLVPPQSLIAAGSAGSLVGGILLGSRKLFACSLATLGGQALFVVGGLRLVGAPASVYRALLVAPLLVARKLTLYFKLMLGRGPTAWIRTERES